MSAIENSSGKETEVRSRLDGPSQEENDKGRNPDAATTVINEATHFHKEKKLESKYKKKREQLLEKQLEVKRALKTVRLRNIDKVYGFENGEIFRLHNKNESKNRGKHKKGRRRRLSMEDRLVAVMSASQRLSNLRYDGDGEKMNVLLGLEPNNLKVHHVESPYVAKSATNVEGSHEEFPNQRNEASEETLVHKMQKQIESLEVKDKEKDTNESDDDEDGLDEDGIFNWPENKLTTDDSIQDLIDANNDESDEDDYYGEGPIHEFFADEKSSLSSVSLSAIFQLLDKDNDSLSGTPSDKTLLAVFADDARFSMRDGLIMYHGIGSSNRTNFENEDPFIRAFKEAGNQSHYDDIDEEDEKPGVLNWMGDGLNRIVKKTLLSQETEEMNLDQTRHGIPQRTEQHQESLPKYAEYVGGPPPIPQITDEVDPDAEIFDARPPPMSEIILDERNGEIPEFVLKQEKGDKREPSVGMSNLRRLRRMRSGKDTI